MFAVGTGDDEFIQSGGAFLRDAQAGRIQPLWNLPQWEPDSGQDHSLLAVHFQIWRCRTPPRTITTRGEAMRCQARIHLVHGAHAIDDLRRRVAGHPEGRHAVLPGSPGASPCTRLALIGRLRRPTRPPAPDTRTSVTIRPSDDRASTWTSSPLTKRSGYCASFMALCSSLSSGVAACVSGRCAATTTRAARRCRRTHPRRLVGECALAMAAPVVGQALQDTATVPLPDGLGDFFQQSKGGPVAQVLEVQIDRDAVLGVVHPVGHGKDDRRSREVLSGRPQLAETAVLMVGVHAADPIVPAPPRTCLPEAWGSGHADRPELPLPQTTPRPNGDRSRTWRSSGGRAR
ncbi:hypothetical protein STANM309S_03697 [Streptomyces tanashiensis]